MMSDDVREDPVLAALRDLRAWDVDHRRARRLRVRCRAALATQNRSAAAAGDADPAGWKQTAGGALLAGWCAVYLIQIVRHAAAIYWL
jgi:hypothetical protein